MGNHEEEYKLGYFREFDYSDQCELHFFISTEVPGVGIVKEEIKAVRQKSDTVSSLLQHIKNKLQKLLKEKLDLKDNENKENLLNNDIPLSLKRENKDIRGSIILKNFSSTLKENSNVVFEIFDQKYLIILNAPLVKQMKLPSILYANFSIQPTKFQALFTDNSYSEFYWYKSTDKFNWERIGRGFTYLLKDEDVDHYIKLVCVPLTATKVQGPTAETISEAKVEIIGELPNCPFERRHEYTKKKLKGLEFRVVSYNILADRYTVDSGNYAYCSPKALAIDYRKQLILKELVGYNADVICLQEVDNKHYTTYFKDKFKDLGYGSIYHRKGNRIPEGLACIFNKSRFKQIEMKHIVLSIEIKRHKVFSHLWDMIKKNEDVKTAFLKQSTSLQVTVFKAKESNKHLIVGNTHLFYHPDANHIRLLQVNMATTYLNMLKRRYLKNGIDVSVIFCGDFNSCPEKSVFPFMIQGRINPEHTDCLQIQENGKALLYHEFIFESSCGTPKYTNYTPDYKGCLDYIFVETNKLKVQQVVPLIEEEELRKFEGLPNEIFPSDHLALVVDLKFK